MWTKKMLSTNNFFEINAECVYFWGYDILPRSVSLTKKIRRLIDEFKIPENEIIEIYNDDTIEFFSRVLHEV